MKECVNSEYKLDYIKSLDSKFSESHSKTGILNLFSTSDLKNSKKSIALSNALHAKVSVSTKNQCVFSAFIEASEAALEFFKENPSSEPTISAIIIFDDFGLRFSQAPILSFASKDFIDQKKFDCNVRIPFLSRIDDIFNELTIHNLNIEKLQMEIGLRDDALNDLQRFYYSHESYIADFQSVLTKELSEMLSKLYNNIKMITEDDSQHNQPHHIYRSLADEYQTQIEVLSARQRKTTDLKISVTGLLNELYDYKTHILNVKESNSNTSLIEFLSKSEEALINLIKTIGSKKEMIFSNEFIYDEYLISDSLKTLDDVKASLILLRLQTDQTLLDFLKNAHSEIEEDIGQVARDEL